MRFLMPRLTPAEFVFISKSIDDLVECAHHACGIPGSKVYGSAITIKDWDCIRITHPNRDPFTFRLTDYPEVIGASDDVGMLNLFCHFLMQWESHPVLSCECGSDATYGPSGSHSVWCPRYASR